MGDGDKAPKIQGQTNTPATVVLTGTPPASVEVKLGTLDAPAGDKFIPLLKGKDTVTVHYSLTPKSERMDRVTITIKDSGGAVVFEKAYTKKDKSKEAAARSQDTGSGCAFTWDGREAIPAKKYTGPHPHVSTKGSPFEVTIEAELRGVSGKSAATKVTAVPLIDKGVVVSRASASGDFDDENKLVDFTDKVELVALVRAQVKDRSDHEWFVPPGGTAGTAKLGKEKVSFAAWDDKTFGGLTVSWQRVMPRKNGQFVGSNEIMGHKDVALQHRKRATTVGEYSNVVANDPTADCDKEIQGLAEGHFLGFDTIEYETLAAGTGASPTADTDAGTVRWRFDADYAIAELALGDAAPGTPGRKDPTPTSDAVPFRSGVKDSDDQGIKNTVHRISRRGSNANRYLATIEAYKRVPWVYGSVDHQVLDFIGFDCADLAFGAARKAGVTSQTAFTNANGLARTKAYTTRRAKMPIVYWAEDGKLRRADTDEEFVVPFGTTPDKVNLGDLLFFDWDGKVDEKGSGKWHHTTIVWRCTKDHVDLDTELAMAHHDGVHIEPMSSTVPGVLSERKKARWTVCSWAG